MKKYYYNNRKLIEEKWYGKKYQDNYIRVKVLGKTDYIFPHGSQEYYLIELPDGSRKEIHFTQLIVSI